MSVPLRPIAAPATEDQLHRFEEDFALQLPSAYRAFLLRHNGGLPQNNTEGIYVFFALTDDPQWSLADACRRHQADLPADLLPIGATAQGVLYCVAHRGPNIGAVFTRPLPAAPASTDTIDPSPPVAASLAAFLEMLEPFDPDDLPDIREDACDDWYAAPGSPAPSHPRQPPATPVRVTRRPRHWSDEVRGDQP